MLQACAMPVTKLSAMLLVSPRYFQIGFIEPVTQCVLQRIHVSYHDEVAVVIRF